MSNMSDDYHDEIHDTHQVTHMSFAMLIKSPHRHYVDAKKKNKILEPELI